MVEVALGGGGSFIAASRAVSNQSSVAGECGGLGGGGGRGLLLSLPTSVAVGARSQEELGVFPRVGLYSVLVFCGGGVISSAVLLVFACFRRFWCILMADRLWPSDSPR